MIVCWVYDIRLTITSPAGRVRTVWLFLLQDKLLKIGNPHQLDCRPIRWKGNRISGPVGWHEEGLQICAVVCVQKMERERESKLSAKVSMWVFE